MERQEVSLHVKSTRREEREGREGVFHGSFDQKDRSDDYSGVGVAGRAVRLDRAYGNYAVNAISCSRAKQSFAG